MIRTSALAVVVAVLAGCGGGSPRVDHVPDIVDVRLLDAKPGSASTYADPAFEALPQAKAYYGTIGSAAFRIEMPRHWNGELFLWAHGVHGYGLEVSVDNPPHALREALIREGYAWGASSYEENGYSAGLGTNDTLKLKRYFAERFGAPKRTYVGGMSLGGHVVALSLEQFPDEFDGGLSICGAVAGESQIDYWLSWGLLAEYFGGHAIPLDSGAAKATEAIETQIQPALGPAISPSPAGRAFESAIRNLTGGPRPFFAEGFVAAYPYNFGLLTGDPGRTLPTAAASTNEGEVYRVDSGIGFESAALNRAIRRLPADSALRDAETHPDLAPTTGRLRDPLLTLHSSGDLIVPVSQEQAYRQRVDAAGAGGLLVQRVIRDPSHCLFSEAEVTQSWEDLRRWVSDGTRPAGDDLTGDLSDAGLAFTNPLRPGDPGGK
ncbi:MAG: hypothetical protein ABI577_15255 [bacterium]